MASDHLRPTPRTAGPDPQTPHQRAPARRRVAAVVGIATVVVLLAGCGTSGRTLRDPSPGATAPARKADSSTTATTAAVVATTPAVIDTAPTPVAPLSIESPAWPAGESIPVEFTCQGTSTSPPLTIAGVPEGTVELVLLVRDIDDDGYLQWVVAGISPGDASFPAGSVPAGAQRLYNDGDVTAWRAPCPPAGSGRHTYEFTVYALSEPSGLSTASSRAAIVSVGDRAASSAALVGTYSRG
jgi:phosphatidylethanolamine-binding protein (PEBP) family uncharacterized protein